MNCFLSFKILEIFTYLIFQKDPLEVHNDYLSNHYLENCFMLKDVKHYISELGIEDHFYFTESDKDKNHTIIRLQNQEKTEIFLKEYIQKYKHFELKTKIGENVNYHCYSRNLLYMHEAFKIYSENFSKNIFTLDSYNLRDDELKIGDKEGRFLEYILDLYFQNQDIFDINWCKIINRGGLIHFGYTLAINIKMNKHPDKIYSYLVSSANEQNTTNFDNSSKKAKIFKDEKLNSIFENFELERIKIAAQDLSTTKIATELGFKSKNKVQQVKNFLTSVYQKLAEEGYIEFEGDDKGKKEKLKKLLKEDFLKKLP